MKILTFLIACFASAALADDFKTIDGKEYKNAKVSRVEPDGIVLMTKSGISKIYFTELPKDVRERFHYDPEKAAAYSAEQSAQARKQQEEAQRQKEERSEKNREYWGAYEQQERIRALEARYKALQQQENELLSEIGEAEQPGPIIYNRGYPTSRNYPNPKESQLPVLHSHLDEVRHEKNQARQQLEQVQR